MKKKITLLSLFFLIILLMTKYDIAVQVALIKNEVEGLSNIEIKESYGEELAELYFLVKTSEFSDPTYSYVKWSDEHYLISVDSILYGQNGEVIDSEDVYLKMSYHNYLGLDILDRQSLLE